jgi:aspartyl-tRNA(Asn)/glutamyl-tRNA(Gln) amidotransferase subunit A
MHPRHRLPSRVSTGGELERISATELIQQFRHRELSPVEVASACLEVAGRDLVNAFCLVDPDRALAQARASEGRWRDGAPAGALDGVPAAVKDLLLAAEWPTLRGFPARPTDLPAEADAPSVAALRRHGAVLIGKTTTPQLGWKAVTDAPLSSPALNPRDPGRTAGGSSGGSAAAVAVGAAAVALGTDGAGSIRIPASFCGIVGLKATFARVPHWPASPFGLLSHAGPMARTLADTALLLDALAEPDPRDWSSLPPPPERYAATLANGVRGLRVAFSPTLDGVAVDPDVAGAVSRAAAAFEELGAHVEPSDPPLHAARETFDVLWGAGAAAGVAALSPERAGQLDPGLAALAERGARRSALDWLAADLQRAEIGTAMGRFHQEHDLLLTPTLPIVAFEAGRDVPPDWPDRDWPSWTPFTYPFNLTQQPAISVPCGTTASGLPVGLQIVGPRHADALVLRAARAFESIRSN